MRGNLRHVRDSADLRARKLRLREQELRLGRVSDLRGHELHQESCHAGAQPAENLDLSQKSSAYDALVGVAASQCSARLLVAPRNPGGSYLLNKLTATDMCSGSRMPKGGSALSSGELDVIRSWIGSGAAP